MKSEIPLQSQQSCLLALTFVAFPPLSEPAVKAQLVRCQIHNPIRVRVNCEIYFAFYKL